MKVERIDKYKKDDSLYFKDLKYGETFICAFVRNDPFVYMKCLDTISGDELNAVRLCDGYLLSCVKGDLIVKKVNGKFVYSLEEGDD